MFTVHLWSPKPLHIARLSESQGRCRVVKGHMTLFLSPLDEVRKGSEEGKLHSTRANADFHQTKNDQNFKRGAWLASIPQRLSTAARSSSGKARVKGSQSRNRAIAQQILESLEHKIHVFVLEVGDVSRNGWGRSRAGFNSPKHGLSITLLPNIRS